MFLVTFCLSPFASPLLRQGELSRKISENRNFLGQHNISVIRPGSCPVTDMQITSCPSKKEFFKLRISVSSTGVVPEIISEAPFFDPSTSLAIS